MINKNKKTIIYYVFNIYNRLFNHFKLKIIRFKRKRIL